MDINDVNIFGVYPFSYPPLFERVNCEKSASHQNSSCWVFGDFLFSSDALSMLNFNTGFRIYLDLRLASIFLRKKGSNFRIQIGIIYMISSDGTN